MKKAIDITVTVVMVLVLTFAFLLVGVRLFGLTPYTVISGSMEPSIPVGSLIYVRKTTAGELKVGDPVTYVMQNGVVVTHRIIEILPDEDNPTVVRYRVKGDANEDPDGDPVHISNVIGKPVFTLPLLGYVAYFVQHPPGRYIVICLLIITVMLSFIPNLVDGIKEYKKDDQQTDSELKESEELLNQLKAMRQTLAEKQAEQAEGGQVPDTDSEVGTEQENQN